MKARNRGAVLAEHAPGAVLGHEAAERQAKLLELDPLDHTKWHTFAQTCMLLRRYEEADRGFAMTISLSPSGYVYPSLPTWMRQLPPERLV